MCLCSLTCSVKIVSLPASSITHIYLFNFSFAFPFVCFLSVKESFLRPMSCDVVVVGGGISGMYMAETLMRMKKEDNVCLFEKDSRFGGRDYDFRFSQAPNISISKFVT